MKKFVERGLEEKHIYQERRYIRGVAVTKNYTLAGLRLHSNKLIDRIKALESPDSDEISALNGQVIKFFKMADALLGSNSTASATENIGIMKSKLRKQLKEKARQMGIDDRLFYLGAGAEGIGASKAEGLTKPLPQGQETAPAKTAPIEVQRAAAPEERRRTLSERGHESSSNSRTIEDFSHHLANIFKLEINTTDISTDEARNRIDKYKECVSGLKDEVRAWLELTGAVKDNATYQEIAKAVNEVDKSALCRHIASFFYDPDGSGMSYEPSAGLLINSIESKKFNCYTSSIVFTNALLQLGMEDVTIISVPEHMLLGIGESVFETTAKGEEGTTFPKGELDQLYPGWHEGSVALLFASTCNWCGGALSDRGEWKDSLRLNELAIKIDSHYAEAWLNKGASLAALERYPEAIEAFKKARELVPDNAKALNEKGVTFNASAWKNEGDTYREMKEYPKALEAFDNAKRLAPNFASAWIGEGLTFLEMGEGHYARGDAPAARERYSQARSDFEKAIELKPDSSYAWENEGKTLHRIGGMDAEAEECFRRARELRKSQPKAGNAPA